MSCTPKQAKFIEDLQLKGAPIPEHPHFDRPDDSMFHSVEAADKYIKANLHFKHRRIPGAPCAPFGISDHVGAGPAAYDVPNH